MAKQTFTAGQVLTATQMNNLQANDYNWTTSAQTSSYVLVAANAGQTVTMTSASATTITVNTGLFAAGDRVSILNLGAGACTITAGTATVNTAGSLVLPQYGSGTLWFSSASAAIFIPDDRTSGLTTVRAETTFTAVSSFTADNVFTSNYSNYALLLNYTQTNTSGVVSIRYRSGGASNSTTNYADQTSLFTTVTGYNRTGSGGTSQTVVYNIGASGAIGKLDIFSPQLAAKTFAVGNIVTESGSATIITGGGFTTTTQFDGIEILVSLGTITGTYSIYGYAKTV